jgi:hypothetical protein
MPLPLLQTGDVLVYDRNSPVNWLIKAKTVSRHTHVEVVMDPAKRRVFASRNGEGCGFYTLSEEGLALVLRPTGPFDVKKAMEWFVGSDPPIYSQGYDWIGLLNFTGWRWVNSRNNKMFCSELATRLLRKGGVPVFDGRDADFVSPGDFAKTSLFTAVYRSPKETKLYLKWLEKQDA